mgnify:CR=1 FL=1
MHRQELLRLLNEHETRFMEEAGYIERAKAFVMTNPECFFREHWPIHVTGSAWVVNPSRSHVLLLHHRKHDQWFQPGGHADGDADILRVALRETAEETGLDASHIRLVDSRVFDVDVHTKGNIQYSYAETWSCMWLSDVESHRCIGFAIHEPYSNHGCNSPGRRS